MPPTSDRCSGRRHRIPAGSTTPSRSLPCGGASVGGASSTCSEPSRLVCPTVAVALAGRSTSPLSRMVTSACHPCTFDPGDRADVDIADPDPGVRLDGTDIGQLRLHHVRAVATALCARHGQRVQAVPLASRREPSRPTSSTRRAPWLAVLPRNAHHRHPPARRQHHARQALRPDRWSRRRERRRRWRCGGTKSGRNRSSL